MTKSIFFAAIATLTLTVSCQSEDFDMQSDASPTTSSSRLSRSSDSYFPDGWQYLETNEERYAALQLPDDMLSAMSTEELVEACMSYPLALDCFAYNDVEQGINSVISRFNGFAELKQRDDAFDKVLDFYSRKLDEIATMGGSIGYVFQPLSLSFYERFIISGYLLPTDELKDSKKFIDLYPQIFYVHDTFEELKGCTYNESLFLINKVLGFEQMSLTTSSMSKVTIYTKGGLAVIANNIKCNNANADITEGRNYIQSYFPNATIIADGTCTYNCHAYAWWVSEGGTKYWIKQYEDGNKNLAKFFSDGTYIETTTPLRGDKVFYPNGDHSAIVYSDDTFTSKWGALALVRHKYNYCPYNSTNLVYYKLHSVRGKAYWDMDPDPTPVNTYESFHINESFDSSRYRTEVFVSNAKDESEPMEDDSRAYIVSHTDVTAVAYFAKPGIYHVCFMVYEIPTGDRVGEFISEQIYVQ